jgi:pyruvate/2-oxoglutarate dehydrogenase complex dihydrolipoamide dehydrogenase (E3) component
VALAIDLGNGVMPITYYLLPITYYLLTLAVDYDLVIIGATAAARAAAIEALKLKARVALVLPHSPNFQPHPQSDLYPHALAQIAASNRSNQARLQQPASYPWKYANLAIDRIEQQSSPALLAARGVDTIVGTGEFCRRPHLAFKIENRSLHARAYLVATGSIPHYSLIPGLQETGYLATDKLPTVASREIPLRWAIIGEEAIGVELAQTLTRLGCQVTLIVETEQILPYEDPDLASLIQAQLEAEGVQIYLDTFVTSVSSDAKSKLVIFGDESIAVDEIFIALPDRPFLETFNLSGVGIEYNEKGISVDKELRTSHPQIYACGSVCGNVLGGYRSNSLTEHEAKIAVRNALSWRKTKVDYKSYDNLPWAVYTDPPLARVGMTISTATSKDRDDLIILEQDFKSCNQAVLANKTSGLCQIIVTRSGRILGATIVGQNAPELIQTLALAIKHKLKITDLTAFPSLSPSYAELIDLTAQSWYSIERNQYNWLKLLLNWRIK